MQQVRLWHWISATICMACMLMFAATGITLNHANSIEPEAAVTSREVVLPGTLLQALKTGPKEGTSRLPAPLTAWIADSLGLDLRREVAEWSPREIYVSLPRPGGEGEVTIDRASGVVVHEVASRGVVGLLNDLHTGRNTGRAWNLFIDIFAVGCLVFASTGLALLCLSVNNRALIWTLAAAGLAAPALLVAILLHGR